MKIAMQMIVMLIMKRSGPGFIFMSVGFSWDERRGEGMGGERGERGRNVLAVGPLLGGVAVLKVCWLVAVAVTVEGKGVAVTTRVVVSLPPRSRAWRRLIPSCIS
jgi:hypothetical protein